MAILTVNHLAKAFGPQVLFNDLNLLVNGRERVAIIGGNGTGKSTLLKIIMGFEKADSGNVGIQNGLTIGYLPQICDLPEGATLHQAVLGIRPGLTELAVELQDVEDLLGHATTAEAIELGSRYADLSHQFEAIEGYSLKAQAAQYLDALGFSEAELQQETESLSGGQKTRASLARLLLQSPDLLLLDEPTNHLDIEGCEWLQSFLLERYSGAALIVSHDRYFMDAVVSRVIELDAGEAVSYSGNYTLFAVLKAKRREEQAKLYSLQQREIARIEASVQKLFSHRKFSRRDSKLKELERIKKVAKTSSSKQMHADLGETMRSGREVIRVAELSKGFGEKELFQDMDFILERGQKVALVGPNGSGKSTFLKVVAGLIEADSGEVEMGMRVNAVYFAQQFEHLDPNLEVIEELLMDANLTANESRDLLARFLFMGDDVFKRVSSLSGGELCRLALAKLLAQRPNLLLLDEPTNHLDILSREALENAIRKFDGAVMIASHDRYLLDAVVDRVLEFRDGHTQSYLGTYTDYRKKVMARLAMKQAEVPLHTVISDKRPSNTAKQIKQNLKRLINRQKELEEAIAAVEARLEAISASLASTDPYLDGSAKRLGDEYDLLQTKLEQLTEQWSAVSEELERLQAE
ncbi:MAG: ABC-F family ATP-binding cassette domain-containing protein [Armatimonadota bacterium]